MRYKVYKALNLVIETEDILVCQESLAVFEMGSGLPLNFRQRYPDSLPDCDSLRNSITNGIPWF